MERMIHMILIGLTEKQKQDEIRRYVEKNSVKHVIVFSPQKFLMELPKLGDVPIEQIEYKEVIMYRTFYPLLERIDQDYLLVVNEFMRTSNRSDLTYNCLRHYLNQCGHQIVFEYFPFIADPAEFMILLDFDTKSKHKGSGFEDRMLDEEYVLCSNRHISLNVEKVGLPDGAKDEYEKRKEELFKDLGKRDPDTVPRELHAFCGRWKKPFIRPELAYVSRNGRYNLPNVTTYPNVERGVQYILLDFQHRRLAMNDFLRKTQESNLTFLSTGLSVDEYYVKEFYAWLARLESFYAKAGIYSRNR